MPAYDDGTTPTLVTEKPPAVTLKVRGGSDTYMKQDGKVGTAGKGALASEEVTFTVAATQDQTLFQWFGGDLDGNAEETRPIQDMQTLWEAITSQEVCKRGSGINARLSEEAVLRCEVCCCPQRWKNEDGYTVMDDGTLPCQKDLSSRVMCNMRDGRSDRSSSQERRLEGQRSVESDSGMPQLPCETTPPKGCLQNMRQTDEGSRILREALSEIQEVRRPIHDGIRSEAIEEEAGGHYVVRRLTPL